MQDQDHAVRLLNSLIETTLDSAHGYREAAENCESTELKTMFSSRSQEREQLTRRLQSEVRSFGAEPEDDQSILGKVHNKFVDLRAALMGGHSDKAVIQEVERGEDFIRDKYEAAAKDEALPPGSRRMVEEALQEIRRDHDTVSALKHGERRDH